jgi:hypothetical protein
MDTRYRFQISAVNASGEGPASTILIVSTMASALARFSARGSGEVESIPKVPPHKLLSIRGVDMLGESNDTSNPKTEAEVLAELRASPAKPKGVWTPIRRPVTSVEPELGRETRTNPDAIGQAALLRRQSKEHTFVRRRTEDSAEMQKRIETAKEVAVSKAAISSTVTAGASNDSPDVLGDLHRKKREFWAETLRRDRVERGSAARDLVGDEDAQRLLVKGELLDDGMGEVTTKRSYIHSQPLFLMLVVWNNTAHNWFGSDVCRHGELRMGSRPRWES